VADGWMWPVPLPALPEVWPASHASRAAAVIELPLGELTSDIAATYRATVHQHPVVNGSSGFEPPYYQALRLALREHDANVLDALVSRGPLLAVVDAQADPDGTERRWIESIGTREADAATRWTFFHLAQKPAPPDLCRGGDRLTPVAARTGDATIDLAPLVDGDRDTFWVTGRPQQPGETLTLDLERAAHPCRAGISLGAHPELFPRRLRVDVSADGAVWTPAFEGRTAGMAVTAAIAQPLDAWLEFPLPGSPARYIRFTLLDAHPTIEWIVTDVRVFGAR
jgi:F5/8 type C domain